MAKANASKRQHNKVDPQNLSERDRDFLTLDAKDVMRKYKIEKQSVYDRRFALNKKIRKAGLSLEEVLTDKGATSSEPIKKSPVKKVGQRRGRKPKQAQSENQISPQEQIHDTPQEQIHDTAKYERPAPVIMRPIEINFESFSIKLNGVPRSIAVNPDTNNIEIDL